MRAMRPEEEPQEPCDHYVDFWTRRCIHCGELEPMEYWEDCREKADGETQTQS